MDPAGALRVCHNVEQPIASLIQIKEALRAVRQGHCNILFRRPNNVRHGRDWQQRHS